MLEELAAGQVTLATVWLLGVSMGLTACTVTCLPFMGTWALGRASSQREAFLHTAVFLAGRVTTYTVLAALAGAAGLGLAQALGGVWGNLVIGVASVFAGLWLLAKPAKKSCGAVPPAPEKKEEPSRPPSPKPRPIAKPHPRQIVAAAPVVAPTDYVAPPPPPQPAPVTLRRGQQISYAPSGAVGPLQHVDIDTYAAWREGKLVFRARPLREVLEELGRYQPVHLTVTAPGILETKVSGVFPTDNLPQAMQTIAATLPVRLTQTGDHAWQIDPR